MEGGRVYGGCHDIIPLLENANNSPWLPSSSSCYRGTMVNLGTAASAQQQQQQQQQRRHEQGLIMMNPKRQRCDEVFARAVNGEDNSEDELDANLFNNSGKKRRLTPEQVEFLEKSFETDNKLEPERKVDLAKQIGLQPKQVSVWFQNRRARHKTKLVEKEFGSLKDSYNRLKVDYDSLSMENENLKIEVEKYKKLLKKEGKEKNWRAMKTTVTLDDDGTMKIESQGKVETSSGGLEGVVLQCAKLSEEAMSSGKSDILDNDSAVVNQSSSVETSHPRPHPHPHPHPRPYEQQQQQQQQQQQRDHMTTTTTRILLPQTPPTFNNFLKLPDDDHPNNTCNFSIVDDQPHWSWLY